MTALNCYFTLPTTHYTHYTHFSDETPLQSPLFSPLDHSIADPINPLLALRSPYASPPPSPSMTASQGSSARLMQIQTSAAYSNQTASRPRPSPIQQNVLHVTSDDSSSDDSSESLGSGMVSPPELARCSRCQRHQSLDLVTGKSNMVSYGLNLWYCTRCAGMVGLNR